MTRLHAFTDDALGDHDAVALRELLASRAVGEDELIAAAVARAQAVAGELGAVAHAAYDRPRRGDPDAPLAGVPTFVKDNTDVQAMPTQHGSEAYRARPARRDGAYAQLYLGTGMTVLGKSRLPEFGFNASTEFMTGPAARNPWDLTRSVGASSGGAAALVAAGVVPIAHANDGGGSIRIPAACAGLVGLKPTRGRHVDGEQARTLPIRMVSEGVVTRSVRDTAAFVAAVERRWRTTSLVPIGEVFGPARRRLRIGLVVDSVTGPADADTRRVVEDTATVLEGEGHVVEPVTLPVTAQFADDFVQYWALLAELGLDTARLALDRSFDVARADGLSLGLRRHHRRYAHRTPAALRRLRAIPRVAAALRERHDVVLSPVLAHVTPLLGHLSPTVPFDTLLDRLRTYASYTPLDNIAGTPAVSLPMGATADGLPIGVQLSGAPGDERTLLELAYLLEAARPFRRIQDVTPRP